MPIDLNADVGEGLDEADAAIIPLINSANIACGGHAGDAATMKRTLALCGEHGVSIGAHPGYPDRDGFGRRHIELAPEVLRASLAAQLDALAVIAAETDSLVRHVKPHGALYNEAAVDPDLADLVAHVVRAFDPGVTLVGPPGSELLRAGRAAGLPVAAEGFADRAYETDGTLRPRSQTGAVHEDAQQVAAQAVAIARDGGVPLDDGGWFPLTVETLCLHGDAPGAADNAVAVRAALAAAGIAVVPLRPAR